MPASKKKPPAKKKAVAKKKPSTKKTAVKQKPVAKKKAAAKKPSSTKKKPAAKKAPASKKRPVGKKKPAARKKLAGRTVAAFPAALAQLLRKRGLDVPEGLEKAAPVSYASQPRETVKLLESLTDKELEIQATRIATYEDRRVARALAQWDSSPIIAELRKRGLTEPPSPRRPIGASFSFGKPLPEWTDEEVLQAAREWSRRGG